MGKESIKEPRKRSNITNSKTARRKKLMQKYQKVTDQKNFEVKKEDFDNDLILSKLKKYLR